VTAPTEVETGGWELSAPRIQPTKSLNEWVSVEAQPLLEQTRSLTQLVLKVAKVGDPTGTDFVVGHHAASPKP